MPGLKRKLIPLVTCWKGATFFVSWLAWAQLLWAASGKQTWLVLQYRSLSWRQKQRPIFPFALHTVDKKPGRQVDPSVASVQTLSHTSGTNIRKAAYLTPIVSSFARTGKDTSISVFLG